MYVQQHERQLMKNAMEMAVLTTIRHPNVVRVFACLTDMVEEAGGLKHIALCLWQPLEQHLGCSPFCVGG